MEIKPIETKYNGHKFRSRLEARWAVFFDSLSIKYQYEPEGYNIGIDARTRYLPDFFLPKTQTWVEVKGCIDQIKYNVLADAVDWGYGLPFTEDSIGSTRGLLLLGQIPKVSKNDPDIPVHPILQHNKRGWVQGTTFKFGDIFKTTTQCDEYFDSSSGYFEDSALKK